MGYESTHPRFTKFTLYERWRERTKKSMNQSMTQVIESNCYSLLLKMAIEIVDFPIKKSDFPYLCKRLPEGNHIYI